MRDQDIYSAIAKTMWAIMRDKIAAFEVFGKIYEDFSAYQEWFVNYDGTRFQFGFDEAPVEPFYKILDLARNLREVEPFNRNPWTHFKAVLDEDGRFKMEFAYVPREKDVIGVYMREGTSEELAAR